MSQLKAEHPDARILIVDDEAANLRLLDKMMSRAGYRNVRSTTQPSEALALLNGEAPDIVLLDLHMPEMDGMQLMSLIKLAFPAETYLPFLMLTADVSSETRERALASGAMDFLTKPFDLGEVLLRMGNLLHTRALHRELLARNEVLEISVRERTQELEQSRLDVLDRLALAGEFRDDATGEHTRRVGAVAALIARELGMPSRETANIGRAAMLHDIGKIGIPDHILLKPEPLSAAEFEIMRSHTVIGKNILAGNPAPLLQTAEAIAYAHHERWDGRGYHGMEADAAPLAARMVTVADTWDALVNDRPYRRAWPLDAALKEMRENRERQFDPTVLDAFFTLVNRGEVPYGNAIAPRIF